MPKNSIRDFSATAGSNTDIQSIDIDENCAASGLNNAIRELMADLKNVSTGAINLETPAADDLYIAGQIYHQGDTDTKINFLTNEMRFSAGGSANLNLTSTGVSVNEDSADIDFRVESNDATHMLFVDGGNNRVGIGDSTPSYTLDVAGDINFTGTLRENGTAFSGGKILQVVQHIFTNQMTSTTSTSFQSTWCTGAITPTSSSSKILVMANGAVGLDAYQDQGINCQLAIYRGTTAVWKTGWSSWTNDYRIPANVFYMDSPATTSATTYRIYIRNVDTYGGARTTRYSTGRQTSTDQASLVLMEIGA